MRVRKAVRCAFVFLNYILVISQSESHELKHPDWHPSGDLIIAEGSCAGGIDLYLIDIQRHIVRLALDSELTDGYPRWFADGRRVVFHRIDENRESRIFVAESSSSGRLLSVVSVTDGPFDIEPSPSPKGTKIAYSRGGEEGQDIAVLDLLDGTGNRVWKTDDAENFPSWHPDGGSIIFHMKRASSTQIYQRDLVSDRLAVLTKAGGPNIVGHYSGKGDLLAYSSERSGDREIYLHNFATGAEVRLTNRAGRDGYPKISPDGKRLAYHSVISETLTKIRIMDLQGNEVSEFSCEDWVMPQ